MEKSASRNSATLWETRTSTRRWSSMSKFVYEKSKRRLSATVKNLVTNRRCSCCMSPTRILKVS